MHATLRGIGVDWSGSAGGGQRNAIYTAEVQDERLAQPARNGRTRREVVDWVIAEAERDPNMVVGFDFAFSLPEWYLTELGISAAPELWRRLAEERLTPRMEQVGLAAWLKEPEAPFWSASKASSGLGAGQEFRRTELGLREIGFRPKSVFQLVGSGQVGRGSLYGMQELHRLAEAGFSVWPFDEPRFPLVVEIYPRLFYGSLKRNDRSEREEFIRRMELDDDGTAVASEDAFDALVSAFELATTPERVRSFARDVQYQLEGRIWELKRPSEVRAPAKASRDERSIAQPRAAVQAYLEKTLEEFAESDLTIPEQASDLTRALERMRLLRPLTDPRPPR